jgi:hypothetical protein
MNGALRGGSQQGIVIQHGAWDEAVTIPHRQQASRHEMLKQSLGHEYILWIEERYGI